MMIERYIKLKMVELEIPSLLEIKQKQDEVLIETVKHYTDSKTQDYSDMINNLMNEGYDKDDIISALVERLSKQTKAYEDISKPRTKQDSFEQKTSRSSNNRRDRNPNSRDQRSSNRGRDSKRSQDNTYYTAVMNVGKNDGLRAPHLIDYLKKNADMYPKNIGDINIKDDQTEFQIHIKAVKRLDQVNDKIFKGRKLKFKITK